MGSDAAVFFPSVQVVGADHGGGASPAGGAGGGRRRLAGPGGLKGWMGRLAAGLIGLKVEGKFFSE
jgi:hypothetical protein